MKSSLWKDRQLSRLMLGTVQFGLPYGIANRLGQPSYSDVVRIVGAAIEGGVNCFDTAAAYGTSEEVLGRALHELGMADRVTVVTKVRALSPEELLNPTLASNAIQQSVSESRRRLQIDCLSVVLFHREADARFGYVLEELRARGWLLHYGVSCDNRPGPAIEFANQGCFSALQIPANVLDNRHLTSGVFQAAAGRGVAIFVRSVYLQGLLLMPEGDVPATLKSVIPARRRLETLAREAGMGLAELALRYMLSQQGVTSVITGVETAMQIKDNLAIFDRGPLSQDLLNTVAEATTELSEVIITPHMWPPKV
jgi:aryl-alcohol dehydrogenase-like predicted oxidoreductase